MRYTTKLRNYCKEYEKIENYELAVADNFKGWDLHHRLELTLNGEFAHTWKELDRLGMYWDRPYFELIFLRRSEHIRIHNLAGNKYTETSRKKISEYMKLHPHDITGVNNPMYGKVAHNKGVPASPESKLKNSLAHKGKVLSKEVKDKISNSMKGRTSPMKGNKLSEESRKKLSDAHKGQIPWNKGKKLK